MYHCSPVTPAEAGVQAEQRQWLAWVPAFAGTTDTHQLWFMAVCQLYLD
jgi:hypothetical protein